MLINGKRATKNIPLILTELETLPSSFPQYISNLAPKPLNKEELGARAYAATLYQEGLNLHSQGNNTEAIVRLQVAEQIAATQPDNVFLSYIDTVMARGYRALGMFDNAAQKFQDSIEQSLEAKQHFAVEDLCKELASLHQQQGTLTQYINQQEKDLLRSQANDDQVSELKIRLALGGGYRVQNNYERSVEQYSKAYSLQQGKVDYDAVRVEQHEVGFSNQEKIGTDNIQQCVAVIIHDPIGKKTALAHVDRLTDAKSLSQDVISRFPNNTKLDVYLVGGRDRTAHARSVSDDNINKVTAELNKYSFINIKSADIGDKGAPSGIVFDPITGKLEHAVPGRADKTSAWRQVNLNFAGPSLYHAFDLTEDKNIHLPVFNEQQQKQIIQNHYSMALEYSMPRTDEAWQANQISNPNNKVAKDLRNSNPRLVFEVLDENIRKDIKQLNFSKETAERLTKIATDRTRELLSDLYTPLHSVRSEIRQIIDHHKALVTEPIKKETWLTKIGNFFKSIFTKKQTPTTLKPPTTSIVKTSDGNTNKVQNKSNISIPRPSYTPKNVTHNKMNKENMR